MTLTQIKYVIEVAKTSSISQAANNLFVSQSAISTALINLETELGKQVFCRSNSGSTLTPFGEMIVPYLSFIQNQLDQIEYLSGHNRETALSFSIVSISYRFITEALGILFNKYKTVGLLVNHYCRDEIGVVNLVKNNVAKIGILRTYSCYKGAFLNQLKSNNLNYQTIGVFPIAITVGPGNPLFYKEGTTVSLDEIKDYPIINYRSIDSGPYSDIFSRLKLSLPKSRIVTMSRSAISEFLVSTNAYLLDTKLPSSSQNTYLSSLRKSFILEETDIQSEIGYIKTIKSIFSPIDHQFLEIISSILHPK